MPQPNWLVQIGFAKEPSWGTATTPPTFVNSVDDPVFDEQQDPIYDRGLRGIRSALQGLSLGAGHTEVHMPDMPWYGDDSGHFLMGMMGTDTITGTTRNGTIGAVAAGATSVTYTVIGGGASVTGDVFKIDAGLPTQEIVIPTSIASNVWTVPATGPNSFKFAHGAAAPAVTLFTHTITMLNSGQPPSYTGAKFDNLVATARQVVGIYFEQVDLKLANPGRFTVGATGRGKLGTNITKPTYPAYSTEAFNVPWQAAFTVGGVANARMVGFDASIKAMCDQIFGMNNTQSPTAAVSDQLTVTGKVVVVPDDYTEFNYYLNNTQPVFSIAVDNGSTRTTLQMSKVGFIKPTILDHKGNYTVLNVTYEAIANATDAGTGNAPLKAVILNSRSTAY
jgi:hypothetical protein